jgi:hypothetical protein
MDDACGFIVEYKNFKADFTKFLKANSVCCGVCY